MKLWQCDWVPSSVADWLCRELDERGIPGTTYTHTLLSLLHPYFCPHPVPKDPGHPSKGFIKFECVKSILNSGQPQQEFEVLFEELEDHVHPDADFPELKVSEILKEGTRRSKKRQKRKLNQLTLTPERIWKVAAFQCLWTASDEPHDLETIIEELFLRLSESKSVSDKESITFDLLIEEDKTQGCYSSNFPPLLLKKSEKESIEVEKSALNWKSLIKDKLSPEKQAVLNPVKECQPSDIAEDNPIDTKYESNSISIDISEKAKKENLEMEIRAESVENGELETKAYCFIPIVRGEGVFRSEMHFQDIEINTGDGNVFQSLESQIHDTVNPEEKGKMEEWECAGSLLAEPVNRSVSVDVLGNRLYERSLVPTEDMRSNSNTDLNNIQYRNEDENIHEANEQNPDASFWSYSSESWKKPHIGSMWDHEATFPSRSCNDSGIINVDQLNSALPLTLNKSESSFIDDPNRFELIQSKSRLTDNWPLRQNWNSFSLINPISPTIDDVFSSQNSFEEITSQNRKASAPKKINENIKNIWSDLNDNITVVNTDTVSNEAALIMSPTLIDFQEDNKNEENLCRSFKQLGLKHLWEDALLSENLTKDSLLANNFCSESTLNDSSKTLENNSFLTEDEYTHKQTDNRILVHKIPCGPSGPYVELRHTESSGFTAVVPQDKIISVLSESSSLNEEILDLTPKEMPDMVSDNNLTAQEEENLLTSPRTHFRPIRQDSHGSVDDNKLEDGQAILSVANIRDSDLVFQRSGSGALYLESDLLTGSPKKYMAYKEPAKIISVINTNEVQTHPILGNSEGSPSTSFVPKFKLINNEKFCQTEEPEGSARLCEDVSQELESRILQNELKDFEYLFKDIDKNWDESYPSNMKMIWEENPGSDSKEAWELELGNSSLHYPKWSTHDLSQTNWSNKQVQLSPMQELINKTSFEESMKESKSQIDSNQENTLSKIKFIWHSPKGPSNPVAIGKNVSKNSHDNSVEFPSSVIFPESWNDKHLNKSSCLQTESSAAEIGLVIPKSPWNTEVTSEDDMNKSLKRDESVEDVASRWQLQWEVDQEADEILGGLLPPSPLKSSPPYSPLKNPGSKIDLKEFNFLDFLEGQDQQHPIEDLDNLEPGWDLNEGFEWGPDAEELFKGDDDDDEEGEEDGKPGYVLYQNVDGKPMMVPVRYLSETLYNEMFGSVDTPIGGSLPDLPGSEFKKASLSLKLSRRSRGEKFVPPSRRPCSFFLEGNCRRSDCKFSHDLLTITCRFWEEGSCLKGDTCPFRHGFPQPTSRRRNRSEGDQSSLVVPVTFASLKEGNSLVGGSRGRPIPRKNRGNTPSVSSFELDSETDFPCLGSSVESKIGSLDEQSFSNLKVTKLAKKKKKFITISKALFNEVENECEKGLKRGRRAKGGRSISIDLLTSSADGAQDATGSSKKKGKDSKECETLRKVLRKRYPVPPPPPFSHEDGTLSDF